MTGKVQVTRANYLRQMGLFNPDKWTTPVHIIGAGATGSNLALLLGKMGVQPIHAYDFDSVEDHNLPNQVYGPEHVGMQKVVALKGIVKQLTDVEIEIHDEEVEKGCSFEGLVYCLVDSMKARKFIWEACKWNMTVPLFIDSRMGIRHGIIYTVDTCKQEQIEKYEESFFEDEEVPESACTERAISSTVALLTSLLANKLVKFSRNEEIANQVMVTTDFLRIETTKF